MFLYLGIVAVATGLAAVYLAGRELRRGHREYRRRRRIEATTPVPPSAVSPGEEATVVGTLDAPDPLDIPIGIGDCVAVFLDVYLGPSDNAVPYSNETLVTPFTVEGESTSVAVDPEAIDVLTTSDHTDRYRSSLLFDDTPEDLPADVRAFVAEEWLPEPEGSGVVRYEQRYVPAGTTGCVHGTVERRDGDLVVGGPDAFVVDATPETFLDRRPSLLRGPIARAGIYLGLALGSIVVGIVFAAL
ncbi:hypothetical protein [Halococcoides cellulosivorans]|uniref:hypothetical protein n=1 Tax=Halococcoides cellulosivorans TaxID=1679096 RepID=UPI001F2B4512|nr:hypothetical protein [Halococcoides cellulosivorans]